jgi:glycosyltransferase involved in cell wall biosynthesis
LKQSYQHLELLIVDDGSTDDTVKIVSNIDDPRIQLFRPGRLGFVNALAFGIRRARGKWVARMDADDISHPYRLDFQIEALNEQKDSVMCGTGFGYITPGGYIVQRHSLGKNRNLTAELITLREKRFADATLVFHRQTALDVGLYDADIEHNELSLWYKLLAKGRGVELGRCTYFQRIHHGGMNIGQDRASRDSVTARNRYDSCHGEQILKITSKKEIYRRQLKGIRRKIYICRAAGDYFGLGKLLFHIVLKSPLSLVLRAVLYACTGRESIRLRITSAKREKTECRRFEPENEQVLDFLHSYGLKIA